MIFAFVSALFSRLVRRLRVSDVRANEGIVNLLARLGHRVISDPCKPETGPLMIRYFIFRSERVGIYLHHFLRSDNDRHVHDHPWSFCTFLFHRGYWEHVPSPVPLLTQRVWRRRFSILYRPATWQHWVEIEKPVWTLVCRFRRKRDWGFITERGWIDHLTYDREWCDE